MNYELAKELMLTGAFNDPQLEPMDMLNGTWLPRDKNNKPLGLEELIEACGRDFIMLELNKVGLWYVQGKWEGDKKCAIPKYDERGTTPIEAVARLWLALHKK